MKNHEYHWCLIFPFVFSDIFPEFSHGLNLANDSFRDIVIRNFISQKRSKSAKTEKYNLYEK